MWQTVFFWIRVIRIVDEVTAWGEGGGRFSSRVCGIIHVDVQLRLLHIAPLN